MFYTFGESKSQKNTTWYSIAQKRASDSFSVPLSLSIHPETGNARSPLLKSLCVKQLTSLGRVTAICYIEKKYFLQICWFQVESLIKANPITDITVILKLIQMRFFMQPAPNQTFLETSFAKLKVSEDVYARSNCHET